MLDTIDLKKTVDKKQYKLQRDALGLQLGVLQQKIKRAALPVAVVLEGWGAAGKGVVLTELIDHLDPRGFSVHCTGAPSARELRRPWLWRFWMQIPRYGNFALFDHSWYQESMSGWQHWEDPERAMRRRLKDINVFERQLCDDGYLVVKFFLHIERSEQRQRFSNLQADAATAWRVKPEDLVENKLYDKRKATYERALHATNTVYAPWHLVSAQDKNAMRLQVLQTLVQRVEAALSAREGRAIAKETADDAHSPAVRDLAPTPIRHAKKIWVRPQFRLESPPSLEMPQPAPSLDKQQYKDALKQQQQKLSYLHNRIYLARIPVVIAYEGWDAAGKGGNIKRLAQALDPRGYEVTPIAAPSEQEKARHYLTRFWKELPLDGHVQIFDRTWYGRVMVERLEGFCDEAAWRRAYNEINEFEWQLHRFGTVVVKFFVNVTKQEQLRRFNDRQNTPEKRWKITDEDWRNRKRWDDYRVAVEDVFAHTNTDFAPWHVIQSEDKRFARVQALEVVCQAIERRLSGKSV